MTRRTESLSADGTSAPARTGTSPDPANSAAPANSREAAKAERRRLLLGSAKQQFARFGFRAVRLGDIGQGAGVSGPAVYRHFESKEAVLTELLVGISEYLHTGGERIIAAGRPPQRTLSDLIDFHVDFALTEPELIRIQDRDLDSLPDAERRSVRRLQRQYVTAWAGVVRANNPGLTEQEATVRVHALFGMVNSTPHLSRRLPAEVVATQLRASARSALGVE
ncbi:TetR/AcrR family transcriptional regulator [Brevibacterium jeotgali]|uniref:Transcriptional regulator, TetR family n=1 Tax=Brevibacterium jeotgali TaxID=1262550 RepID=A0A2H1L111_9MICO|nr:TetR/AcrR family transcriptional regulator [Brevibacterium jeotgali]TWC02048.1 TetR family transcriptional regulator [Brevibacterium jeotgali]SMY10601.1 transcriptional regulator, TetR family [Brevibacterium jeotgali]